VFQAGKQPKNIFSKKRKAGRFKECGITFLPNPVEKFESKIHKSGGENVMRRKAVPTNPSPAKESRTTRADEIAGGGDGGHQAHWPVETTACEEYLRKEWDQLDLALGCM